MYLSYYGLDQTPFSITSDHGFMYWSSQSRDLYDQLRAEILDGSPVTLFTGPVGVGKTHMIRKLLADEEIARDILVVSVWNVSGSGDDVLQRILAALPGCGIDDTSTDWWQQIHAILGVLTESGKRVVFVVDEAQSLSAEGAQILGRIAAGDAGAVPAVPMVLVGQPELQRQMSEPGFEVLKKRLEKTVSLGPLTQLELDEYIHHRLKNAGSDADETFDGSAIQAIHAHTNGIPRLTNKLCEMCLVVGEMEKRQTIDAPFVEEVFASMGDLGAEQPGLLTALEREVENGLSGTRRLPTAKSAQKVEAPLTRAEISLLPRWMRPTTGAIAGLTGLAIIGGVLWNSGMQIPAASERMGAVAARDDADADQDAPTLQPQAASVLGIATLTPRQVSNDLRRIEEHARARLVAMSDRHQSMRQEINAAHDELGTLQVALESGRKRVQDMETQRDTIAKSLTAMHDEIARLADERIEREQQLKDLSDQLALARQALIETEQAIAEAPDPTPQPRIDPPADVPLLSAAASDGAEASLFFSEALSATSPHATSVAYARAALSGHEKAAIYLGQLFETGDGVGFLPDIAQRWYAFGKGHVALHDASLAQFSTDPGASYTTPLFSATSDGIVDLVWEGSAKMFTIEVADADEQALGRFETPLTAARLRLPDQAVLWRVRADADGAQPSAWHAIEATSSN